MLSASETAALLHMVDGVAVDRSDPDLRSARAKLRAHYRTLGASARVKQELLRGNISVFPGDVPYRIPGQLQMGAR